MSKRSEIMLCYPFEERRLLDPKFQWKFPVIVQPKLDGERCRAINRDGKIILLSSECNEIISVPHINEQLQKIAHLLPYYELDGELYIHGWTFNEIHSVISRQSNSTRHILSELMQFHIFDHVSSSPQISRIAALQDFHREYLKNPIKLVSSQVVYSLHDIMKSYNSFINEGYEGIIVRHISAPYVKKRSRFMMKFKPKKDDYYKIVDINEAISLDKKLPLDGRMLNMIGSFRCVGSDGTKFNIGAGKLTHQERWDLWKDRQSLIGKFAHVQYQNITSGGVPRFGLCIEIVDKNPEETSGDGIL